LYLSARSLSTTLSAEAKALDMAFPFVTFPTFETLCTAAREQGGFEVIFYEPLVNGSSLEAWNLYSVENQGWMEASRQTAISYGGGGLKSSDYIESPIQPAVYFGFPSSGIPILEAPEYGPPPYLPIWMQSPPPFTSFIINFDVYYPLKVTTGASINSREIVMNEVQDVSGLAGNALNTKDHDSYHKNVVTNTAPDPFNHPHTSLLVPVFEEPNDDTSKVVGMLTMIIAWDKNLADLLPEDTAGVVCVLKNTCGQAYTYKIEGNKVSCDLRDDDDLFKTHTVFESIFSSYFFTSFVGATKSGSVFRF
jgi:hypothetical protein